MTVGSPFDSRAQALNVKRQWREWSGFFASSAYAAHHEIEVNAIRNAAAIIDVSPLFKYRVSGPDAQRLVDRVITRDATKLARGQVYYTPWCDEHGKVIDDGTVSRLDDDSYRWTAADAQIRWLRLNARGLDVTVEETSERVASLALQGPLSRDVLEAATGESFADLRYFRRRASRVGDIDIDVSRTGYTGDLGYELWADAARASDLWDALMETGRSWALRPAGMLALDVVRVEAGLILLCFVVILDTFFYATGIPKDSDELPFLRDVWGALNGTVIVPFFRESIIPVFMTVFAFFVPTAISGLY